MNRARLFGFLACAVAFAGVTPAASAPLCHPSLAFKQVQFSPIQPPIMQRTWAAVVAVDASRCATDARGRFEILFTRLQEFGPDSESGEEFIWAAPEVIVTLTFAASEAVARYRIGVVTPCPCAAK